MNFISMTTIFATPVDLTLQERAVETLVAADEPPAAMRRDLLDLLDLR